MVRLPSLRRGIAMTRENGKCENVQMGRCANGGFDGEIA